MRACATVDVIDPGFGAEIFKVQPDGFGGLRSHCLHVVRRRVAGDPVPVLVSYQVALSTGSAGSYVQRRMQSGANGLGYNLYTSNNYSQVWGNGSGSTRTVSGLFLFGASTAPSTRRHTMYGRVPARQDVAVGAYADNVLVTVTY